MNRNSPEVADRMRRRRGSSHHSHQQQEAVGEEEEGDEGYGNCGCSHLHRSTGRFVFDDGDEDDEGGDSYRRRRDDFLVNFRELLWFWREYYEHRGRDRLSLEFSSHIRFPEWKTVVDLLCMDTDVDVAPTCLVSRRATAFPRSPYSLPPRRPRTSTSIRVE